MTFAVILEKMHLHKNSYYPPSFSRPYAASWKALGIQSLQFFICHLWGFDNYVYFQVMFVGANSQLYTPHPSQCEFIISVFESPSGELDSPRHTLPYNTVCHYHFRGRRHEVVWITFLKYQSAVDQSVFEAPSQCTPQLRIWDGKMQSIKKNGELRKLNVYVSILRWTALNLRYIRM